jgi:hypothetical protein
MKVLLIAVVLACDLTIEPADYDANVFDVFMQLPISATLCLASPRSSGRFVLGILTYQVFFISLTIQ